jgi:hypothetical protein
MTTTYTIIDSHGRMIERHVSLRDAADYIMTSDGRRWMIEHNDDGGYVVWVDHRVAGKKWHKIDALSSDKKERVEAEDEIRQYIISQPKWSGHCEAMTDREYDEMMGQIADDDAIYG